MEFCCPCLEKKEQHRQRTEVLEEERLARRAITDDCSWIQILMSMMPVLLEKREDMRQSLQETSASTEDNTSSDSDFDESESDPGGNPWSLGDYLQDASASRENVYAPGEDSSGHAGQDEDSRSLHHHLLNQCLEGGGQDIRAAVSRE